MPEDCICPICKGCGLEFNDYHAGTFSGTYLFPSKGDEEPFRKKCSTCKGTGQVIYDKGRMLPGKMPKKLPCVEVALETLVVHGVSLMVGGIQSTVEMTVPESPDEEPVNPEEGRTALADAIRKRLGGNKIMPSGRKIPSNSNRLKVKIGDIFDKREVIGEPFLDDSNPKRKIGALKCLTRCECGFEAPVEVKQLLEGKNHQCKSCSKKEYHTKKRDGRGYLTSEQVLDIYKRAHSGKEIQRIIAKDYDIDISTVCNIKKRKIYKQITEGVKCLNS